MQTGIEQRTSRETEIAADDQGESTTVNSSFTTINIQTLFLGFQGLDQGQQRGNEDGIAPSVTGATIPSRAKAGREGEEAGVGAEAENGTGATARTRTETGPQPLTSNSK